MKLAQILIPLAAVAMPSLARADKPARDVFAIIVTNNHSNQLGRPDLRYADDDGAKYYETFATLAPAENIHLLTEFDRDTLGLFPHLAPIAQRPTQRAVADAALDVAGRARTALQAGHTVEVYFVFAGHGDVDHGSGFVELADGPLTSETLDKEVLSGIPATHTHVILDSCNSFFVISARKPGGHRFATPNDIAETFAKKLPHVGVFLSTSAEQEVYEWSELQSGIFSHAVRSGLAGAADVDGDGVVSYSELRAFVTVASARVKNPLYRPNVFARGPGGKNDAPLVDLAHADAVTIGVGPDETRLTVRDRDALPWIDAHTERGAKITLRIPRRVAEGGAIEEIGRDDERAISGRWTLPAQSPEIIAMRALTPAEQTSAPRGPQEMLRTLFDEPFGPDAMAHVDRYMVPVQVFGVASEDAERMDLLLGAVADQQRSQRIGTGAMFLGTSALIAGLYAYSRNELEFGPQVANPAALDYTVFGASIALAGLGLYELLTTSEGEQIQQDYRRRMTLRRGDDGYTVAQTERRLGELAGRHARIRQGAAEAGWIIAALSAGALVANELGNHGGNDQDQVRLYGVAGLAIGGLTALTATITRTPEERIYALWHDDPGIRRIPRLGIAPAPGGGLLSFGTDF